MRVGHLLIIGFALTVKALAGVAQEAAPPEKPFTLRATAELVLLDVSVKNRAGGQVSGLTKSNFHVYEDGKRQKITHFASDDVPVTVGLVIDTSGSMRVKHHEVVTAALAFIHASNRNDEMFVVNFGDRASCGLPENISFTDDINELRAALSTSAPEGRTALYDAVLLSLNHLAKGTRGKKALVLVSDGGDNNSIHGPQDAMRMVREARATIYTIGIFDESDCDRNPALLRRIARVSGGEAFLPVQLSEVVRICRRIAGEIRSRYTIGYVPVRFGDKGSLRNIKVVASRSGGQRMIVNTRESYLLPDVRPAVDQDAKPNRKPGL